MVDRTGLEGEWNCNEGTGATAWDHSGNGRHLTLTNGQWGAGIYGNGLLFLDRAPARSAKSAAIDASAWTGYTLALWVSKTSATGADNAYALSWGQNSVLGIEIRANAGSDDLDFGFQRAGGADHVECTGALSASGNLFVVRYNAAANAYVVWKDGVRIKAATLAHTAVMPNAAVVLGNYDTPSAGRGWIGGIDEARLWSRELTDEEVADLTRDPGQGSEAGTVLLWHNNDSALVGKNVRIGAITVHPSSGKARVKLTDEAGGTVLIPQTPLVSDASVQFMRYDLVYGPQVVGLRTPLCSNAQILVRLV